jgi:hypothetical protein
MFGIEPSKVRTGNAKFDVCKPAAELHAQPGALSGQGALSHLGIQVATTDDVVAMKTRWETAGLVPREEMQTTCCYALQGQAW